MNIREWEQGWDTDWDLGRMCSDVFVRCDLLLTLKHYSSTDWTIGQACSSNDVTEDLAQDTKIVRFFM